MKIDKKIYSVVLASAALILFFTFISSYVSAATVQSVSPIINETRITTTNSASGPIIFGNRIVYADNRNGDPNIYMYDLTTHKETQITNLSVQSGESADSPAIYDDKVVWAKTRDVGNRQASDIYMYNLSTSVQTTIKCRNIFIG
jgi:beta propeller repeat protein